MDDHLTDIDGVLADAGLTHEMLTAVILIDEGGWLEEVQNQIKCRYQKPQGIWTRATGQLQRIRVAIDRMGRHLEEGNILRSQRSHVSLLKGVFGLPRALLNRRDYLAGALEVFGVSRLDAQVVRELHETALEIIAASGFSDAEQAIRVQHLQGSRWLLEHAGPAEAAWPLCFWSSTTVEEAGGDRNPASWEMWRRFAMMLGVDHQQQLLRRLELAAQLLGSAVEFVQAYRPELGLGPAGS